MDTNTTGKPNTPRETLLRLKSEFGTWQRVGAFLSPRFNAGYLWHVARGRKPASAKLCAALGLPPPARIVEVAEGFDVAPVCAKCGVVHTTKRCTKGKTSKPRARAFKWGGVRYQRHEGTDQI